MTTPPRILILITGGTIDSWFDPVHEQVKVNNKSYINEYLKKFQLYNKTKVQVVCLKDSRAVSDTDREKIVRSIQSAPQKHILITHGTFTMTQTAKYLQRRLPADHDKKIVITGSLIPLHQCVEGDAPFNLGYAIGCLQHINTPGIYVAMNGALFDSQNVQKNLDTGQFEEPAKS